MLNYTDVDLARIDRASIILKAIAHPIRLSILGHLSDGESFTVSEIQENLGFEQGIELLAG